MRASLWYVLGGVLVAAGCSSAFTAGTGGSSGSTGTGGSASSSSGSSSSSSGTASSSSGTTTHSTTTPSTTHSTTISSSTSSSSSTGITTTTTTTTTPPPCPLEVGTYIISGTCGTVDKSVTECIKPQTAGSCVHVLSATGGAGNLGLGVTGTVNVDSSGDFNNMNLTIGGVGYSGCTGNWTPQQPTTPATLQIQCSGGCDLTLTRTADTCP